MEHVGSETPTSKPETVGGGTIRAEVGFSKAMIDELQKRGHNITTVNRNGGGFQGIWIDPKTGMLHGGSESRKDGAAVGY